jgi:hypothetical protein
MREPPRLATNLLKRLGLNAEPISGDLLEGYQSGQSRWWYWRQVATAVAFAAWCDCRGRKAWAVGATGLLVVFAGDTLAAPFRSWLLYRVMQPAAWSYPIIAAHPFIVSWTISVTPLALIAVLTGWLVGLVIQSRGVLIALAGVACVSLLADSSVIAAEALFGSQKHMPVRYFPLFFGTMTLLPTLLVIVGGLHGSFLSRQISHE